MAIIITVTKQQSYAAPLEIDSVWSNLEQARNRFKYLCNVDAILKTEGITTKVLYGVTVFKVDPDIETAKKFYYEETI